MSDDPPAKLLDRAFTVIMVVGEWLFRSLEVMIGTAAVSVAARRTGDAGYAAAATAIRWAALIFIAVSFRHASIATGARRALGIDRWRRPTWLAIPLLAVIAFGLLQLDGRFPVGITALIGARPE